MQGLDRETEAAMNRSEAFLLFAQSDTLLRRNFADEWDTRVLQTLMADMAVDCGPADGIFGGRTEAGVVSFQAIRLAGFEHEVPGVVGPSTKRELVTAHAADFAAGHPWDHQRFDVSVYGGIHPTLGATPSMVGDRVTTFGGPDDFDSHSLALAPVHPLTTAALYSKRPKLVKLGLFRDDLPDPLPHVVHAGRRVPAGMSWCLNPDSYYIAMRWRCSQRRPDPDAASNNRVLVIHGDQAVVAAPVDWGPALWTGLDCGLSQGCADALGLRPPEQGDDGLGVDGEAVRVLWAENNAPLGPVGLR